MRIALLIIVCLMVGFFFGSSYEQTQWEKAYEAFSNPDIFCLTGTKNDSGMKVFQYKEKQYPLMTTEMYYKLAKSHIWCNNYIDALRQFATGGIYLPKQYYDKEIADLREFYKGFYEKGRIFEIPKNK